jgi:hypothetical protein
VATFRSDSPKLNTTALVRTYRPIIRNSQSPRGANFRLARQPPTIVTWAELHFYDLPTIRPSGFVNSAALVRSKSSEHVPPQRADSSFKRGGPPIRCCISALHVNLRVGSRAHGGFKTRTFGRTASSSFGGVGTAIALSLRDLPGALCRHRHRAGERAHA